MAGKSILMGTSTRYDGGVVSVGRAPAKATGGSLTAASAKLIGRWTLPNDDALSTVLGFSVAVGAGDPVAFPEGASPDENLGKVNKWQIEGYALTQLIDAWVVTVDRYGNPSNPTAANALYLGRKSVVAARKTLILAPEV